MVCSLPQNYSSPIDYQYYLVVTLKCRCNQPGSTTTPPPKPRDPRNNNKKDPPPKKGKKATRTRDRKKDAPQKKTPPQKKKKEKEKKKKKKKKQGPGEKKVKKKRELSLPILPRRKRLLTSLHRERLVRRGLQQQYLMRFSNLVKFMYARIIK